MLGIDLSALSGAELSRLLDASRAKGQAEMTNALLREFARRGGAAQAATTQAATAMSWSPSAFEAPQTAPDAAAADPAPHPARWALIAATAVLAITASVGAGWWLTRSPAPSPAASTPLPPPPLDTPAPPTPIQPSAVQAAPSPAAGLRTSPKPTRHAAHARRHAKAHRPHRHHPAPPPRRRHGLLHRLTDWLDPPDQGR